jgi:hypothetical protein
MTHVQANIPNRPVCLALLFSSILVPVALGQVVLNEHHEFNSGSLPLTPPDPSAAGVSHSRSVVSSIGFLTDVNVSFTLSNEFAGGAYNGDYFVSLTHETGFAVLLNRVGKRADSSPAEQFGYSDNGFRITLDDQASNGDVHQYRLQLSPGGSHNTPVDVDFVQPLTGRWAPDGRNPGSSAVSLTTPRTAMLNSFNGLSGSGNWTLFVADLNAGGTAVLENWKLELSGTPVPEPESLALAVGGLLVVWRMWMRRG